MTINIVWDNPEKTIARYDYEGKWSWEELYKALQEFHQMLDTVNHPVDVIIDMQRTRLLPENVLARGSNVGQMVHPNQGITVVVGANSLVRAMADLYKRIYAKKAANFFMASKLDEAHAIIAKDGKSRSSSPPAK
jgi:hypothetical protein